MFEFFNVPNTALIPKLVLPMYANGKTCGLTVDSGFNQTQVVPVYEGYPLRHAMRSMPVGGLQVTQQIMQMLNDRGYSFNMSKHWDDIRDIKEKLCYCALDFKNELANFNKDMQQQFKLPDGMLVTIKTEALVLFNKKRE